MNSDPDARILSAWESDPVPARDALFRIALMERIERRRYRQNLALAAVAGVAVCLLAWLVLPGLSRSLSEAVSAQAMLAASVLIGLLAAAWGTNRVYRII